MIFFSRAGLQTACADTTRTHYDGLWRAIGSEEGGAITTEKRVPSVKILPTSTDFLRAMMWQFTSTLTRAKYLSMAQTVLSLMVVVMVAARAINLFTA